MYIFFSAAELEKFRRLQMEVDADIQKFKEDRQRRIIERENEKREDLQMLKNYDPWGKPGAGAPYKVNYPIRSYLRYRNSIGLSKILLH